MRVLVAHAMSGSGDLLVPQLGGETLLTKPPLFYWMLSAVESVTGLGPIAARLPAVLSIWWTGCVAFGTLARLVDRRTAWIAGLSVVLAPSVVWHGAFAEIDPLFASLTCVSVIWLLEGALTVRRNLLFAAGFVAALAMLTKGPPVAMFVIGPLFVALRAAPRDVLVRYVPALVVPLAVFVFAFLRATAGAGSDQAAVVAAAESVGRIALFDLQSLLDVPAHFVRATLATLPFTPWVFAAFRSRDLSTIARFERACVWGMVGAVLVLAVFPARPARYLLPGIPIAALAASRRISLWVAASPVPPRGLRLVMQGLAVFAALACVTVPWLPYPLPGRTWSGAIVLGCVVLLARTRAQTMLAIAIVPVLVVGTIVRDRGAMRENGLRDERAVASILHAELEERGVRSFEFWGNPGETFALYLDPDARWRDRTSRDVGTDWVVARWYDGQERDLDPTVWIDRVAVRGAQRVFVLAERRR